MSAETGWNDANHKWSEQWGYVSILWFTEWVVALGLSVLSKRMVLAGRKGWDRYVLLRIYEGIIVLKKLFIFCVFIIPFFKGLIPLGEHKVRWFWYGLSWTAWPCFYNCTYIPVIIFMAQPSGGVRALKIAFGIGLCCALLSTLITWGECAPGYAGPGHEFFDNWGWGPSDFVQDWSNNHQGGYNPNGCTYLVKALVMGPAILVWSLYVGWMVFNGVKTLREPRGFWIMTFLAGLSQINTLLATRYMEGDAHYGHQGYGETRYFLLFQCLEMPFQYWAMSLDSRYWCTLATSAEVSHSALEELSDPLLHSIASEMHALRQLSACNNNQRPPQIPFFQVQLGEAFAAGGGGTIHRCKYLRKKSATGYHELHDVVAKRTVCTQLSRQEVQEACAEMFYLQSLQSEFVVDFI